MSQDSTFNEIQMDFYLNYYTNVVTQGKGGRFHRFTHELLEKSFSASRNLPITLEIGGGSGEHFKFVNHEFETYYSADLRETRHLSDDERISQLICDAAEIPLEDGSCDRVIVTCLLHHLADPMGVLLEIRRLVKVGGFVSILIPSDPGMLYRFLRRISSERKLKKLGFTRGKLLQAVEHRNHVQSLIEHVDYVFERDNIKLISWPLPFRKIWNLNLLFVYNITKV